MVIDGSGDVVLYDLDGNEIQRIAQTVEDILPVFAADGSHAAGKTIFAAEEQEDGSLIVRFDPDSGLTEDELIRLIRAASSGETDATSAATFVSTLEAERIFYHRETTKRLSWRNRGEYRRFEFDRYDAMMRDFAAKVERGPSTDEELVYEAMIHRVVLAACGIDCDFRGEIVL